MAKLYNIARMTTATTGTGTITLGSAATGFLSFAGAGVANGETVTYGIEDGSAREIGRGVYTSSGTTLTRTVLKSTNSDAAISLSGTAQVFITAAKEDFVGKQTIAIPAAAMWPRTTNGPSTVNRELTTGGDIQIKGLAFDTTTEEAAQFYIPFPKSWDKGTVTFMAYWTNPSGASTETVSWGLSMGAYTDSDALDSTDLGTEVRVSDTWLAQNDLHQTAESAAVTVGNTPVDDDLVIGQIARSVANDNMTGDAELLGIKIFYNTIETTDL